MFQDKLRMAISLFPRASHYFGNFHSLIHCVDSTILHRCSWSLWTGTCMLGMLVARLAWVSLSDSWLLLPDIGLISESVF